MFSPELDCFSFLSRNSGDDRAGSAAASLPRSVSLTCTDTFDPDTVLSLGSHANPPSSVGWIVLLGRFVFAV